MNKTKDFVEKIAFNMFCSFIEEVEGGNLLKGASSTAITVEDILQFATGRRTPGLPGDEDIISIKFIDPSDDCFPRPVASTCTCELVMAVADDYKKMKEAWVDAIAQLPVGFSRL